MRFFFGILLALVFLWNLKRVIEWNVASTQKSFTLFCVHAFAAVFFTRIAIVTANHGVPIVSIFMVWVGHAYLWGAIAYLGVGLRVYRRADGFMEKSTLITMWPVLCVIWSINLFRQSALEPFSRIDDNVFLGIPPDRRTTQWHAVLDLTTEYVEPSVKENVNYLNLPCLDRVEVSEQVLEEAFSFIERHRKEGPVLVHCALGKFRSARAIAHWISQTQKCSKQEAWMILKTRRPCVISPYRM